jgi:predicted esterase YcpF (UPF0227 family)
MNILYYHGLDSHLSEEKRKILENYGNVTAPTFDYRKMAAGDVLQNVIDSQVNVDCDLVIGSSLGGLMAYIASELKNLPCLLFNPALYDNSLHWDKNEIADPVFYTKPRTALAYIVLGKKDKIVDYRKNWKYIKENVSGPSTVISIPDLEHRIPINIFEYHVASFFQTMHPSFILPD